MKGTSSGYTKNGVDYPESNWKTKTKIFAGGVGAREFLEKIHPANIISVFATSHNVWVVYQENENG